MDRLNKIFLIVIASVGLVTLALQVPAVIEQRGVAADRQAESDLQSISSAVTTYALDKGNLPDTLDNITLTGSTKDRLGKYEYKPGKNSTYELCATFNTDTSTKSGSSDSNLGASYSSYVSYTDHKKGRHCFTGTGGYSYSSNGSDSNSSSDSSLSGSAKDTEIRTDLNYIHTYLGVYYASAGVYPTLAQLQDQSWRKTNTVGLIDSDLEGPNGETLGAGYTYTPGPDGCQTNCTSYTLSAKYSDGTTYTKQSQ